MAGTTAPLNRAQQLQRLVQVSRDLAATSDMQRLLQTVVQAAAELTHSEAASVLLVDERTGQLRFEAAPGYQNDPLKQVTVPLTNSFAGWIFQNRRPKVIHNVTDEIGLICEAERALHINARCILGVPLLIKEDPVGVIEALNKKQHAHYTEDDLEVLETLATQTAIALENGRLNRELQQANQKLLDLDRMKSDFIAISSHELRTPLGLIMGHATYLREIAPQDYQEQIDVIIRSASRLKTIVEDMASIAHSDHGQSRIRRARFSVALLVEDVVGRFEPEANEKSVELSSDVPGQDPLLVEGDKEKIELALSNLVDNAITFTDPGGKVGVKAEGDGDHVQVFVVDSGIGIPADDISRVFERFYQVESHLTRIHGGMGLGLSIAKAMIEMHNGQIWCESKEGVGSLFSFILPANEERAKAAGKIFQN